MDLKIKEFFDECASRWDDMEPEWTIAVINKILDRIAPSSEDIILDAGCGTGVLLPFLKGRGVKRYTGLDCSDKMLQALRAKFPGAKTVAADYQSPGLFPDASFSKIIIYNAFPHFTAPPDVFDNSFRYLKRGGGLYIVHSMNRKTLDLHHKNAGIAVEDHVLESDESLRNHYQTAGFIRPETDDGDYFYSCGFKP